MSKVVNLKESWAIVDGLPVHYWQPDRSYEPGTTTVIHLHGFGISGTYLLPTADLLATDYQNYVPDLPGYGRSVHPIKVLSIPELAVALLHFMDVMGIEKATLIGNSMGCLIAIEAAYEAPERIERLILVSAAGGPNNRPIYRGIAQLSIDGLRESPSMFLIAFKDYLHFGFINVLKLFWAMIHYPTIDRVKESTVPILAVLGGRDPLVNEAHIVEGTEGIATIEVIRIDGAAHAINYSHPHKLANLVRQYLSHVPLCDDPQWKGTVVVLRQREEHSTPPPAPDAVSAAD